MIICVCECVSLCVNIKSYENKKIHLYVKKRNIATSF